MYQNNNYSSLEGRISDSNTAVSELVTQLNDIYTWIDENRGTLGDTIPPTLTITAPTATTSGSPTYTSSSSYTVKGTASDDSGISKVTVNGTTAELNGNNWSLVITLSANTTTTLTIVATDGAGNQSTATRYVYYDSSAPSLNVSAPAGTSSSSPTYYQSDSTVSYTVSGTVSDNASGIKSVTVNGSAASISGNNWSKALSLATNTTHTITIVAIDGVDRTTTITRYIRIEAFYQQAARTAGTTVQTSLANTLTNSTVCTAIAGNSTAYGIMKSKYSSNMKTYIDSNFNDGLNLLNYKCTLKCYLFNAGNSCTNITGGWNGTVTNTPFGGTEVKGTITSNQLNTLFDQDGTKGVAYLRTTNSINRSGYSKVGLSASVFCHPCYSYDSSTSISTEYDDIVGSYTASPTSLPTFNSGNSPITIYSGNTSSTNNRQAYWKVSKMWLE